ncbi:hypothetical protein [Ammoniphilus sp. CFH 90114]|uniref:hypothetical protein n=1 Tax=Ammoniphilus sp. CFH 90114 TaxID=2493665 RepID=UPI00100E5D9D|nr:hypothetical protein [Ammoniphilus sp. CFH 90114]RXT05229.1 hypothetical protein EIZ39_17755 [Ammoniphilus sp. CFH 90114]
MNEEMRRQLQESLGQQIEIQTKTSGKIRGVLSWLSPDRCMAEITLTTGEINTVTDVQIKSIRRI